MEPAKPPIEYASPQPPTTLGRRSRRLRREAYKLSIMTGILAASTGGLFLYGLATGALDDRGDHTPIYLSTMLAIFTAVFGLIAGARYLESRSGD